MFKKVWDTIMDFIYSIAEWAIMLLPDSPFQKNTTTLTDGPFNNIMNYINYFVPIGQMLTFLLLYLTAVATWYIVRWALRLTKYIG